MTFKVFAEVLSKYGFAVTLFIAAIAAASAFGKMAEKADNTGASINAINHRIDENHEDIDTVNERIDRHIDGHN